jgi:hypothetical protein
LIEQVLQSTAAIKTLVIPGRRHRVHAMHCEQQRDEASGMILDCFANARNDGRRKSSDGPALTKSQV